MMFSNVFSASSAMELSLINGRITPWVGRPGRRTRVRRGRPGLLLGVLSAEGPEPIREDGAA